MPDPEATLRHALIRGLDEAGVEVGAGIAVACSGGPDSVALADLLQRERGGRVGEVSLIYVDHQLRDTAGEIELVAGLAERWSVPHRVVRVDVDRERPSLEAAAREVRYRALADSAAALGADWIATGHTASDQAETVVLRMLRGTGVEGLVGIARRRGRIVRPLLDAGREAIAAYLETRDLAAAIDPTNAEPVFARNRVRATLMPGLAAENPRIEEALCRLARSALEMREVVDAAVADLAGRAAVDGGLSAEVLAAAPALIAKRVLEGAALAAGAGALGGGHLEALYDLATRPARGSMSLDLPSCRAVREYDRVRFGEIAAGAAGELEVSGPDRYEVRRWQPGDRMRPARLGGRSRKLSDLYIDAKVPRRLRKTARVVVRRSDGAIEWAEHLGAAHDSSVAVRTGNQR